MPGPYRMVSVAILVVGVAFAGGCDDPQISPPAVDTVAPARITDLRVAGGLHASLDLVWTATGDDGNAGAATTYDVRISTRPFDAASWAFVDRLEVTLVPGSAGTTERLHVPFLASGTPYYFAVRALDELTNTSPASDVVMGATRAFRFELGWHGAFSGPHGITVDDMGRVYVADTAQNLIKVFTSDGTPLRSFGATGTNQGQFAQPYGIAFGSGALYVADTFNERIQAFSREGLFLFEWGEAGDGNGQFQHPVGIATDPDGNVYVTDSITDRVQRFDRNGVFRAGWGMPGRAVGTFDDPVGVAADAAGNVFVVDQGNQRIQVFTRDGVFVRNWGHYGTDAGGFIQPAGIAVDSDGAVYVTDEFRSDFQKFTPRGSWIGRWLTRLPEASRPNGIAIRPPGFAFLSFVDGDIVSRFGPEFPPD